MMRMLDVYLFVCKFVYCVVLAPNMVIFRSSYTYEMHANNANAMLYLFLYNIGNCIPDKDESCIG